MATSWQNERTIELAVMMGTMLQDELNAITVGIFLHVESGYMTWLNYRLLDTLSDLIVVHVEAQLRLCHVPVTHARAPTYQEI